MSAHPVSVAVRPGAGVVARTGAAVMVILPGGSEDLQRQLLDAFTSACEGQATPGRMLARRMVGLLSQSEPDDVPPFGACAPSERGWAVILHQGVSLRVDYAGTVTSLSGFDASTWVDRIVDDGFTSLALGGDDADLTTADMRYRFDGGVIPGAGVTIQPAAADHVPTPGTIGADMVEPVSDELDEQRRASGARADAPADAMSAADGEMAGGGEMADGMGDAAPLPERPLTPQPQPAPQQAPPAPVQQPPAQQPPAQQPPVQQPPAQQPPAQQPPVQQPPAQQPPAQQPPQVAPPSAAPAALHGAIPTPTPDPAQQPGTQATPAQAGGDLFAKPAPTPAPPAQAPTGYQGGIADEDEPPTLIQSSDRDAQPVPTAHPQPEEMPAEDVPFESVPLLDIGPDARRDALPVLSADTPKDEIEDTGAPLVYGVLSPTGYFNHPDALFCAVTGVSMLHRTHALVQRPRPPLGVVVADDGSTFTLNSNYIVGREPERDPQVEADQARPLKLQDAERSLSRVHAEIRLIDWDVVIVDRGSANGTYVLPRGGQQWKRLVADTPETIVPGTRVAFGKRVMTYESHHQINQAAAS